MINGKYEYKDIVLKINGKVIEGIKPIEYDPRSGQLEALIKHKKEIEVKPAKIDRDRIFKWPKE